jgi:UDP-N-acetylmuramoyl-tripeptide--D-alanyl-D-alanine ligase
VFNADDVYLKNVPKEKLAGRLMPYSIKTKSRNAAVNVRIENASGLNFVVDKKPYFLRSFSVDMAYNALAAIVCARILQVSAGDVQDALKKFRCKRGRQEMFKRNGVVIINDSYNANPVSMRSAISMLESYPALGRRILICADMLELGARSKVLHQKVGECVAGSKTDVLMTFGDQARLILEAAHRRNPQLIVFHFFNMEDLKNYLYVLCRRGDVILVKGSRRMKMEDVVNGLLKELGN